MGFFDFLRGSSGGDMNREEQVAEEESYIKAIHSLDIDVAMMAHNNWKSRLELYLVGNSTEDLRPEVVCCDDRCDLGKWIYGDGHKHLEHSATFADLKATHKMFHYVASTVVTLSQAGNEAEARRVLEGDFAKLSGKIETRLGDLKGLG